MRELKRFICVVLVFAVSYLPSEVSAQQDEEIAKQLSAIVEEAKKLPVEKVWSFEEKFKEFDPEEAADIMLDMLPQIPPKVRLLFDKVLFFFGEQKKPISDIMKIVTDPTAERDVRITAVDMLGMFGSRRDADKLLDELDNIVDDYVKIAACKVIFERTSNPTATKILRKYLKKDDFDIQAEAAIALAQLDEFIFSKPILERLKKESSRRGQLARSLLKQDVLYKEAQRAAGLTRETLIRQKDEEIRRLEKEVEKLKKEKVILSMTKKKLLDEVIDKIRAYYVDEKKTSMKDLLEAAAKGMAHSLDAHSAYLDEKEVKLMQEKMEQEYSGIGAVVSKKPNDYLVIETPIYGGPAYEAGLRSGDKITEVEGKDTREMSIAESVKLLKGKEGTPVKIKVWRRNWPEEREFVIIRAKIELKSIRYRMLKGDIGYIHLSEFNRHSAEELEKALVDLEKQGMKALILDLRNNPGGLLKVAVRVADKFLPEGKLIVTSKGRNPMIAPEERYYSKSKPHPRYPMVVLINGGSASASEIVAGALKVHGRATLVGERTYGKGSVQQIFAMESTGYKTRLKLTVALYYLPDGKSIDRSSHTVKEDWGVEPDIVIEQPDFPPTAYFDAVQELLDAEVFLKYLDKYYPLHKKLFRSLAENDSADYNRYPGFNEWYKSLKTNVPKDIIRVYLRAALIKRVADDVGKEPVCNFVDDVQLQRAILEALKKRGSDISEYQDYEFFKDKFKDRK